MDPVVPTALEPCKAAPLALTYKSIQGYRPQRAVKVHDGLRKHIFSLASLEGPAFQAWVPSPLTFSRAKGSRSILESILAPGNHGNKQVHPNPSSQGTSSCPKRPHLPRSARVHEPAGVTCLFVPLWQQRPSLIL